MDDHTLERVHRRVRTWPEYLAWVFDRYDDLEPRQPAAGRLAEHLGVSPRDFLRLGLYRRPRDGRFQTDVTLTAAAFGVDRFRLADVVRAVDLFDYTTARNAAAAATSPAASGMLLAARARTKDGGTNDTDPPQASKTPEGGTP